MTRAELLKIAKPILFNTEMVKAILEGRKTVTRRIVKLPKWIEKQEDGLYTLFADGTCYENKHFEDIATYLNKPCSPGNILYVRETWSDHYTAESDGKLVYCYKADGVNLQAECLSGESNRWYPSIHMPKEAARIFLKVKDVRMERLKDITEDGAIHEGVEGVRCDHAGLGAYGCTDCMNTGWLEPPTLHFMYLWNSTINKSDLELYGWDANPYVWVIEFERIEL